MASYRNNRAINIETKGAAKEKNKRLLKEYFFPLAAKLNQKLLQGGQGGTVFSKRVPPCCRRQNNG
jgi:hypothetical protein